MKHVTECSNLELLTFKIEKQYKGHKVTIKPLLGKNFEITSSLHVIFRMFNDFDVDLGLITQEIAEDDEHFNYFIEKRLKYIGNYLLNELKK